MTNQTGQAHGDQRIAHLVNHWSSTLRAHGYRLTPPRQVLLTIVVTHPGSFSSVELLGIAQTHYPKLGLATIYRTLETFEQLGVVPRLHDTQGCHHYMACREAATHAPPLLHCHNCGRLEYLEGASLQAFIDYLIAQSDYQIDQYWLQLSDLCRECH